MTDKDKKKIIRLEQLKKSNELLSSEVSTIGVVNSLLGLNGVSTRTLTTSEEWKVVCLDKNEKVLFGVQQNGTFKRYADMSNVLDVILSSYSAT